MCCKDCEMFMADSIGTTQSGLPSGSLTVARSLAYNDALVMTAGEYADNSSATVWLNRKDLIRLRDFIIRFLDDSGDPARGQSNG